MAGDVVRIETGKTIPGDAVLIEGQDVEMDESAMTGESDKLKKLTYEECVKLKDNMKGKDINYTSFPCPILISGTKIFKGTGLYMIIVVGDLSSIGDIKKKMNEPASDTPLQEKLEEVAGDIGKIGLYAAVLTVLAMLVSYFISRGQNNDWSVSDIGLIFSYLVLGLTVLVVAIPEGLPLAVTISLAYSVMKMYQENNFVKTLMVNG